MPELTLADALAAVVVIALNAYVLLAGADFGGGVWDLLASGPRRGRQRDLIAHAIGPVWEANHVWLILVLVLLFTCFPPAFSRLAVTLHLPLTLMLVGIVLRGSAFVFRSYGSVDDRSQRQWGLVFAIASAVTPVLLGISLGAVASGQVTGWVPGGFRAAFVAPWLAPFPVACGLMALALFAFLAAVYLTVEAEGDEALQEDFRRRALWAGAALFGTAMLTLLASGDAPEMRAGLLLSRQAIAVQLLVAAAAIGSLHALWIRRWRRARVAAAAQASLMIWGWALAQYPDVLPGTLSIHQAAAPTITLELVAATLALGAVVLLPSLAYLFRVFKQR
jgi:cytochrome d ubiquinol oxidase subunit II